MENPCVGGNGSRVSGLVNVQQHRQQPQWRGQCGGAGMVRYATQNHCFCPNQTRARLRKRQRADPLRKENKRKQNGVDEQEKHFNQKTKFVPYNEWKSDQKTSKSNNEKKSNESRKKWPISIRNTLCVEKRLRSQNHPKIKVQKKLQKQNRQFAKACAKQFNITYYRRQVILKKTG